jgi:hypothetical protein
MPHQNPLPNQTKNYQEKFNTSSSRLFFLNTSGFVEVEVGQEAVLNCRVKNLARQHTVSGVFGVYVFLFSITV